MLDGFAHIGVDQQHPRACLRHGDGEIGDCGRFILLRGGTGNLNNLFIARTQGENQVGTDGLIRLPNLEGGFFAQPHGIVGFRRPMSLALIHPFFRRGIHTETRHLPQRGQGIHLLDLLLTDDGRVEEGAQHNHNRRQHNTHQGAHQQIEGQIGRRGLSRRRCGTDYLHRAGLGHPFEHIGRQLCNRIADIRRQLRIGCGGGNPHNLGFIHGIHSHRRLNLPRRHPAVQRLGHALHKRIVFQQYGICVDQTDRRVDGSGGDDLVVVLRHIAVIDIHIQRRSILRRNQKAGHRISDQKAGNTADNQYVCFPEQEEQHFHNIEFFCFHIFLLTRLYSDIQNASQKPIGQTSLSPPPFFRRKK